MSDTRLNPDVPRKQPVQCPIGNHAIFVRGDGTVVPHYANDGSKCPANDTLYVAPDSDWPMLAEIERRDYGPREVAQLREQAVATEREACLGCLLAARNRGQRTCNEILDEAEAAIRARGKI